MSVTDWGVDIALVEKWSSLASAFKSYGFYTSMLEWGKLQDGLMPLANQQVILEGRRYPYEGRYRAIAKARTDAKGSFTFRPTISAAL